ncbi:translation elongation factor 4 [Candidatus Margulisiibacteriota bacterium]
MDISKIRNFSIIAHIDHGKSTLADRLLEDTGTVSKREMSEQLLDTMDIERERGITIKLNTARLKYKAKDGQEYELNLIDTPGHVDFTYEVSRSLNACEGVLLVIDASQGIEAQTLANVHMAMGQELKIIPIINKIDLPNADPELVKKEIEDVLQLPSEEAILTSAKDGNGITEVLEAIVERIPPPKISDESALKALIYDSIYDNYKGVIVYARLFSGKVKKGDHIRFMNTGREFEVLELGVFKPKMTPTKSLSSGEVGYIVANVRNIADTRVGDTITSVEDPAKEPLPGYKTCKPMVFCGLYPINNDDYPLLRDALGKLQLNDSSLFYEPETSQALGFGFRCGFLGLLHLEVVQERLRREFNLGLIATTPSVIYKINKNGGQSIEIDNPVHLPSPGEIETIEEPYVKASMILPSDYVGKVMELCTDRRGVFKNMEYIDPTRVLLIYEMPLSEIIIDFFNHLKSRTRGYASLDYELIGYQVSDMVKLDILLNGEIVDALSAMVHRDKAHYFGRKLTEKLKDIIPRHMFEIPIQAAIGSKVIARETVRAMRKDVTAKCYGGDITRKRKLLEKQKDGKRKMKNIGSVELPQEAFLAVLKIDE